MMRRTATMLGLACLLSGCLLPPTRYGTQPCIDGVHRPRHYAILPADITIFASPADEAALRSVQPQNALQALVAALEQAGHKVKGSIDVGGRVQSARHMAGIEQVLHPSDIHTLRVSLYERAEELNVRRSGNGLRLSVDRRLTAPVLDATGADASLYLYVSAYVAPEQNLRWRDVGDAAKEIGKGVAAFAVGVALLAVVGHLSIGVGHTGNPSGTDQLGNPSDGRWTVSASWSSSNLRGKRFEWKSSGGDQSASGIAGPILVARSQTPVLTSLPCVTCGGDQAAPDTNQLQDPSTIPPTLVGLARRVASSEVSATLVAVDNRTGAVLWASSQYGPNVSLARAGMLDQLVTRFAEKTPRCGEKPWQWDRRN